MKKLKANNRFWVSIAVAAMVFASCGGETAETTISGQVGGVDQTTLADPDDSTASTGGDNGAGSISDAPQAGEAILEVDGQTIEGMIHTCEVSETSLLMGANGELNGQPVEFGANGGGGPTSWIIQANVATETGEVLYNSSNVSDAEVDGSSFVVSGEWVWNGEDGSLQGGQGVLSATCP